MCTCILKINPKSLNRPEFTFLWRDIDVLLRHQQYVIKNTQICISFNHRLKRGIDYLLMNADNEKIWMLKSEFDIFWHSSFISAEQFILRIILNSSGDSIQSHIFERRLKVNKSKIQHFDRLLEISCQNDQTWGSDWRLRVLWVLKNLRCCRKEK